MTKRAVKIGIGRTTLFSIVAMLSFTATGQAWSRDNKQFAGKKCTCACIVGGKAVAKSTYDAVGHCFTYNRKTCSVEVNADGAWVIRTGYLEYCARDEKAETADRSGITTVEPGTSPKRPPKPERPPIPTAPAKPQP